ncbi:MAG: MFS transporter [Planctomycetota bacterium]
MTDTNQTDLAGINSSRLFAGSCLALISTSVAFGVVTSLMEDFKSIFILSNEEAGWIGGATIWGFTISIFIFGPLCDAIGMRRLMRFSLLCHIAGPILMIFASGFWMLFSGGLIISLANGTVEAVCNPLVTTIYPDRKTEKLNQFHVWFPGGIVIGGLLAFGISMLDPAIWDSLPLAAWQAKLSLILVPTVIYGVLFTGQKFPVTERVQSGVSFGGMVQATLFRPLFLVLFLCMGLTASIELGPNRWMGEVMGTVMESFGGEHAGILVLVYGSGLMAILRFFAGPVVHRLSPTGLLVFSAVFSGVGLLCLTYTSGALAIFLSATVFYVGVCYFWPTMLGVASERVPKGGALALGLLGGWGMAVVGLVTVPVMGMIVDHYGHDMLPYEKSRICIEQGVELLPKVKESLDAGANLNIDEAIALIQAVSNDIKRDNALPKDTAKALRSITRYAGNSEAGTKAQAIITPADDYGGLVSFRWVSALSIFLVLCFGFLYIKDRARGGYKIEKIRS